MVTVMLAAETQRSRPEWNPYQLPEALIPMTV